MEKVTVSKEVYEAFKSYEKMYNKDKTIMTKYWVDDKGEFSGSVATLGHINFDTFIALLYGNYEVEKTVDDKVMDMYNNNVRLASKTCISDLDWRNSAVYDGFNQGVKYMNKMYKLGLKLEGKE